MADQYTRHTEEIVGGRGSGASIQYLMAPALTGSGAGGAILAAGGAGTWGAYTALINGAGLAVATEFWVCGLEIETAAVLQIAEFEIRNVTLALNIGSFVVDLSAKTTNYGIMPIGQYPVHCNGGQVISARTAGVGANAINCHLSYAIGL